jgi:clan AA aspartic protease (TIGR02281 family)
MKKLVGLLIFILFFLSSVCQTVIQMEYENGVYYLPCKVNEVPLRMIFDTGASTVTIAIPEAQVMIRNGTLTDDDVIGRTQFMVANGQIAEGTAIILRKIEIGGLILRNIRANVVHEMDAPLLLGQSVLEHFGDITLNTSKRTLTINKTNKVQPKASDFPDIPLNGLFKYTTYLKNNINNVPLYGIIDDEVVIFTIIRQFDEIRVIRDIDDDWLYVNLRENRGFVEKQLTRPQIK